MSAVLGPTRVRSGADEPVRHRDAVADNIEVHRPDARVRDVFLTASFLSEGTRRLTTSPFAVKLVPGAVTN
jgi:hypothetical protein